MKLLVEREQTLSHLEDDDMPLKQRRDAAIVMSTTGSLPILSQVALPLEVSDFRAEKQ